MKRVYVVHSVVWEEVDDGHFLFVGDGAGIPVRAFAGRELAEQWVAEQEAKRFFEVTDGRLGCMAWTFDDLTHMDLEAFRTLLVQNGVDWPEGARWSTVVVPRSAQVSPILKALKVGFFQITEVPLET